MRNDEEQNPGTVPTSSSDRPATARPRMKGVWSAILVLLTATTCWAIASWASAWLVPPYLLLMALILFAPSGGRPRDASAGVASTSATTLEPARPDEGGAESSVTTDSPSGSASAAPESATEGEPTTAPAPAPIKGKRGRGRPRKAKTAPVEPTEASWVQVGPGKFVRVEAPASTAEAGPHEAVGVPVEVSATPQPPSAHVEEPHGPDLAETPEIGTEPDKLATDPGFKPAEDVASTFDPVEGRDDDPAGVAMPEPPSDVIGQDEGQWEPESVGDDVPAADGIAPQAEDAYLDAPESDWAEASPVEEPELAPDEPICQEFEEEDPSIADHFSPSQPTFVEDIREDDGAETPLPPEYDPESESQSDAETPAPAFEFEAKAPDAWPEVPIEENEANDEPTSDDPEPIFVPEPPALAMEDVIEEVLEPSFDESDPSPEADLASSSDDLEPLADALDPSDLADLPGDSPEPEAVPDALASPAGWISRILPRSRTRVGPGRPAIGNATPSRRHARSRRPSPRRPLDPRQPSRRGFGRARQITRTTPPRSPPCTRRSVGG